MKLHSILLLIFFILSTTYGCSLRSPEYPYAENNVTQNKYFGTIIDDTYQWMEPDSGAILDKWVTEQTNFTDRYLKKIDSYEDIHNRVKELNQTLEFFALKIINNKIYYLMRSIDSRNNILNVIDANTMKSQLIIDSREIIGSEKFTTTNHSISGDGNYIAFIASIKNRENKIFIYDITNSVLLPDVIANVNLSNIAWAKDGFYYSISLNDDYESVAQRICYHKIGDPQIKDKVIFENDTKIFDSYSPITTDKESMLAIIEKCTERNGNSIYVKDIINDGLVKHIIKDCMFERKPIELNEKELYMITFDDAPKGKFVKVNLANSSKEHWETIIPESSKVLTSVTPIKNRFIVTYQDNFSNEAWFYTKEGKKVSKLNIPNDGVSEFFSNKFQDNAFFTYTSATCPTTLMKAKKDIQTPILVKLPNKIKFDPREYVSEVINVPTKDKRSLPINLIYKKGIKKDGTAPAILFCHSEQTAFYATQFFFTRVFYLEQGYIFIETMKEPKILFNKEFRKSPMGIKNEIEDFITTAKYLTENKITSKEKLCVTGREKGATIVMAAIMKNPEIANVVSVNKGIYDLLRYPSLGNGWSWSKYFGSPTDSKKMFDYMYSYSPLHNIKKNVTYPATIIMTEDKDYTVPPAHSYKLAATLQRNSKSNNPVLLHISPSMSLNNKPQLDSYSNGFADQAAFVLKYTNTKYKTIRNNQ